MKENEFDQKDFLRKLQSIILKLSKGTLFSVLCLCYAFPDAPQRAKAIIAGALGYLLSPFDAIPDFIPGGYADDAVVIAAAIAAVAMYITPEVKEKAEKKMEDWFGNRKTNKTP